jgi:hypothetical protein
MLKLGLKRAWPAETAVSPDGSGGAGGMRALSLSL